MTTKTYTQHNSDSCNANESDCDPAICYNAWEIYVDPDGLDSQARYERMSVEARRQFMRDCGWEER